MKKWKIVTLSLFGAVTAAVAGVAIWQWDNIKAVYTVMTRDSETIARELEEQREQHRQELEERVPIDVEAPTSQQTEDVFSGSSTPQEVKDKLGISDYLEMGKAAGIIPDDSAPPGEAEGPPDTPGAADPPAGGTAPEAGSQGQASSQPETGAPAPPETPADTPRPPESGDTSGNTAPPDAASRPPDEPAGPAPEGPPELTAQELINICVAELYSCQVDIMDTLRTMKEEARSQWHALPASERTSARKREIGLAGLDRCYELEVETDNKVLEILDRYRPLLEERGADTSILDVLWKQYVEEKSAEKAYYLDKYMN